MGVRLINSLIGMFSSRTADSPAPASPPQPAEPQLAREATSAGRTDCQNDFIKNVEGIIATSQTLGTAQGHLSAQVLHWRVERTIGSGGHPTFSLLRQTKGNRWKKVLATSSTEDLLLRAKQAWVCRTYIHVHSSSTTARSRALERVHAPCEPTELTTQPCELVAGAPLALGRREWRGLVRWPLYSRARGAG
jgi:hypothetical protein